MLFDLVDKIFSNGRIPDGMATREFIVMFKPKKPNSNDPKSYRALRMLNHAFKLPSGPVVEQLVAETESSMPEWQGGFCEGRGARDTAFIVRSVTTKMLQPGNTVAFSFVDHTAPFDSISPMAAIQSLTECKASRKSVALVRVTCSAATAQMRDSTATFPGDQGALQGCRLSPVLFIIVLAAILKNGVGGGATITGFGGSTVDVDVLGHADDPCLAATNANVSSAQTASLADKSADFADMAVNAPKTEAMHVRKDEHSAQASLGPRPRRSRAPTSTPASTAPAGR